METRSTLLLGTDGIKKLNNSKVIVFGCGGVGGFVIETLARTFINSITIVDFDTVNVTNKNRQIIALESTLNKFKVAVMKERILDINPKCEVLAISTKVTDENIKDFNIEDYDYVIDCIDDVSGKIAIIKEAKLHNKRIITCTGTGNKLDPTKFKITDISKTEMCPLAKKIRLILRKENIKDVKCLFSTEEPITSKDFISSVSFVPSVAGILIAREVILDIIK